MKTVAVVPLKSPSQAKTRLAGVLPPTGRANLAREMLSHVLHVLASTPTVSEIAVISPDTRLALPSGVTLLEQNRSGLNSLLEQGREWAIERGAEALLVVFADLPLLATRDIEGMIAAGRAEKSIVLAPDRHRTGTNAMLAHPPSLARFAFGDSSYEAHRSLARQVGAALHEYLSEGTSLDVDTPEDLAIMESKQPRRGARVA